jgi:cation:H+ antiporter
MVIIGFGTSAPELVVSALSAAQGNPGIALGNAYGSNIANIALILGITALIKPIAIESGVLKKELPILTGVTFVTALLLWNYRLTRIESIFLLILFVAFILWSIRNGMKSKDDTLVTKITQDNTSYRLSKKKATVHLIIGLLVLVASSRILVWGSVEIAQLLGVSDVIIGLTIVAIGTSLPELASAITASRKGEHELALGNIIGSNMFNTLAVVGIAGTIHPLDVPSEILSRDILIVSLLTISIFLLGLKNQGQPGRINRFEGGILAAFYVIYLVILASSAIKA